MRTLKRTLALVLALVMVLGFGAFASAAEFTDAEEIKYAEAVEVLTAAGVFTGYEAADGSYSFQPANTLIRAEAAVMIARLMGADDIKATAAFSDLEGYEWAESAIAYCASEGIVEGYDGKFNPGGELTASAWLKMLCVALGYDAKTYGMTGDTWEIGVAQVVKTLGLTAGNVGVDQTLACTREEAALYALNAASKGTATTTYYVIEDSTGLEANEVPAEYIEKFDKASDAYLMANAISEEVWIVKATTGSMLAKKNIAVNTEAEDAYGRPGTGYTRAKTALQTKIDLFYADKAAATVVVTGVTNNKLSLIAKAAGLKYTGEDDTYEVGDVIEVYADTLGNVVDVVELNTVLAKIAKVTKTTSATAAYTYTVTMNTAGGVVAYTDVELTGFDAATMVKDTYVLLTAGTGEAVIALPEVVTGKQTAKGTGYVKIDGVAQSLAGTCWNINDLDYTNEFNLYKDANGYVVGYAKVAAAPAAAATVFYLAESNVVVGGTFAAQEAQIAVQYLDGKKATLDLVVTTKAGVKYVKIGGTDVALSTLSGSNQIGAGFYAYTLNAEGKVATLTAVNTQGTSVEGFRSLATDRTVVFTAGDAKVVWRNNTNFYANEATTLTTVSAAGVATTVTGYKNFPAKTYTESASVHALAQYDKNNVLKAVYVLGGDALSTTETAVYGAFVKAGDEYYDATKATTYQNVIYFVDGAEVEYKVVKAQSYAAFAKITVTNGVAALEDTGFTKNAVVTAVTDSYILVAGSTAPVYFAANVAYYDATAIAKNGVGIADGVMVGDVITYTTAPVAPYGINRVFVTYAAQEDGVIATKNATYIEKVLGFDSVDATNAAAAGNDWIVVQYTRPAATTKNEFIVKNAAGTVVYHEYNAYTTAGIKGFMVDPAGTNVGDATVDTTNAGITLDLAAGTYTYTVECNDIAVLVGTFVVA